MARRRRERAVAFEKEGLDEELVRIAGEIDEAAAVPSVGGVRHIRRRLPGADAEGPRLEVAPAGWRDAPDPRS